MAAALAARGLTPGDRLCVYLANRIELIDLYLASVKLGVIFVPINILYREREIAHIVKDAEPKLTITERELADLTGAEATPRFPALDGDAPAALVYTSGTTGASKGAILTHNNFAINAVNLTTCWQIAERDRFLLALPLFHVHALGNGLHCWLASGCRMRLLERFEHQTAVEQFLDFRPTLFFGVPAMYVRLLETPLETAREIGRRMRLFVSGSAPLPAQVLEEFRALFGHTILERYGMTETMMNHFESVRRRAPRGHGRIPAARRFRPHRRHGRAVGERPQRFRGLLETTRIRRSSTAGSRPAIWRRAPRTVTTRCAAGAAT